jgi:hypothetical protein
MLTSKFTIKQRKALKAKAWTLFSKFIRNRDGNACVTCSNSEAKGQRMNAGHYIHKREDFNEKNINCQCFFCNKIKKGNMRPYTLYMVKKYGIEYVEYLLYLEKFPIKLESAEFYLNIIEKYS